MKEKEKEKLFSNLKKHKKSNNPKVSVIVPVFKVERYLAECLNSIINQTLEDIEIIIVDEGLEDRCREIIDFYEKNDPRIVAPHKANGGYGASCNLGINMAKGEYLAIVESDDYIEPEMYEEMYEYAKQLDADIVKTPYIEFFADGRRQDCSYRKYMREVTPSGKCFSLKEFGNLLCVHASLWAALYKTDYMLKNNIEFIKAKGGAYVDVGFRIDTLINTDKIAWLDKPYYNYRIDSVGSTTNNFNLSKMIDRWKEAHEKFVPIQNDYDKYYGKFLILDEFLNTVGWMINMYVSKKDYKKICENLSFIKEDTIKNSDVLSDLQKQELLMIKQNPEKAYNFFNLHRRIRNFKISYLELMRKLANPIIAIVSSALFITFMLFSSNVTGLLQNVVNSISLFWLLIIFIYGVNIVIFKGLKLITKIKRFLSRKLDLTI